jgi:hypothetical protein
VLDAYRQRFTEFHTHTQREHYLYCTGRQVRDESQHWLSEYSDLFQPENIQALSKAFEETSSDRINARAALARLWAFAEEGRIAVRVRELAAELANYESQANFTDHEHPYNLAQAEARAWQEAQAAPRREFSLRADDLARGGNDLRAELIYRQHAEAQANGYDSLLDLLAQRRGIPYDQLQAQLQLLLMLTEREYRNEMALWLPSAAGVKLDDATCNDVVYARRHHAADEFFSIQRACEISAALCEGWGWQLEKLRQFSFANLKPERTPHLAHCFSIAIPQEIKLGIAAPVANGVMFYQQYLQAFAAAQHAAWTSANLPYECRAASDPAVALAWGYLFSSLLQDQSFLMGQFGLAESTVLRRALALGELFALRRDAALWLYEQELYAGKFTGLRADGAPRQFTTTLGEALCLRLDDAQHLRAVARPLRSADRLRARAFAAQFAEHCKMKFGSRWWASRQMGEMLVDLWNTGHRYTVEELAALISLGSLSYDWLASSALSALFDTK